MFHNTMQSSFSRSVSVSAINGTSAPPPPMPPRRYAVIGGGFAGVAVSWHLLRSSTSNQPVQLDLFDAYGLGAGGSGAAAGLLHPYTPRGKVLWKGLEAFKDALSLVQAAEDDMDADSPTFVWRRGLLRPARNAKLGRDFSKFVPKNDLQTAEAAGAHCVSDFDELENLVPGLDRTTLLSESDAASLEKESSAAVGLFTANAAVLHPLLYLEAVWRSCQKTANLTSSCSSAQIIQRSVTSLAQLERDQGPYDAIVVAAGAAVDSITELAGKLPLDLCQGYTLDMKSTQNTAPGYPENAPGLLGSPYISPQGNSRAIVGATQRHEATIEEAIAALGPNSIQKPHSEAWNEAVDALIPAAGKLWPPIAQPSAWQVDAVRSGYRAIPVRTSEGSIPYAGKVLEGNWWVIGGLGARGLVYHAWLGRLVAEAMVAGNDEGLPSELLRWKTEA